MHHSQIFSLKQHIIMYFFIQIIVMHHSQICYENSKYDFYNFLFIYDFFNMI